MATPATTAPVKKEKRKEPRRGHGPAKAKVSLPDPDGADGVYTIAEPIDGVWPADPEDPRLTVAGIVLGGDGKIDLDAYKDLFTCFAGEPAPDQHPDAENPGVRKGEKIPRGLRIWDDVRAGCTEKDGAGWIASRTSQHEPSKTKWFNIRQCGSWRMAYLLARLQRLYWDDRTAWVAAPITAPSGHEARKEASATPAATEEEAQSKEAAVDTPKAKRARPSAEGDTAQKKRQRQTEPKEKAQSEKAAQQPEQPALKTKLIASNAMATSVRMQQILAARQQQK